MKIAIPKERRPHERRVAASPESVKKLIAMGFDVTVEKDAGLSASFTDDMYKAAGASIAAGAEAALKSADIVLKVQRPGIAGEKDVPNEVGMMKKGAVVIAALNPHAGKEPLDAYAKAGLTTFSMELVPRITRAQAMDILSSQSNLAGYRAVIDASYEFNRAFPMMMTAAGTVAPAKVFVLGAGVAGLQAVATAKRLGAVVSATDVRPVAKEQVESLGGTFIMVEDDETRAAETSGGYAKEMSAEYKKKQAALVAEHLAKQDIAICTALIPGRPAPVLIDEKMVKSMKTGSIIVDLAVEQGGNCPLSVPGKVVEVGGVKIIGHINVPSRLSEDASALYARNLFNLLKLIADDDKPGALAIDWEDEIVKACVLTHDGKVVNEQFGGAAAKKAPAKKAAAKKPAAKKTAAKTAAKKPAAKKTTAKKSPAKKPAAKKASGSK